MILANFIELVDDIFVGCEYNSNIKKENASCLWPISSINSTYNKISS